LLLCTNCRKTFSYSRTVHSYHHGSQVIFPGIMLLEYITWDCCLYRRKIGCW